MKKLILIMFALFLSQISYAGESCCGVGKGAFKKARKACHIEKATSCCENKTEKCADCKLKSHKSKKGCCANKAEKCSKCQLKSANLKQVKCPVMGGKINKDVFVKHNGEKIYFCCPGCDATFKKNPTKWYKKYKKELVKDVKEEKITQTTCPVMGGKINKKIYAEHKGNKVYFCCKGCIGEFKSNPEKYLKKLK